MATSTTMEFEKPIAELERQIDELKKTAGKRQLSMTDEIAPLERKLDELRAAVYKSLTPLQRVQVARNAKRPFTLDYIQLAFTDFIELHGDRAYREDAAIVGGWARLDGETVMVIGQQRGRDTKENLRRNFGMPHPEGYRKALRLMKLAEKFHVPVLTFIDTPGAWAGLGAEERGQSEAILWKDGKSPEMKERAASALRLTAEDLLRLRVADEVVPEPLGGAHASHEESARTLQAALIRHV